MTVSVHWRVADPSLEARRCRFLLGGLPPGPLQAGAGIVRPLPAADVPTRQTSSSGRPKSPRIQVVLPEELCARLSSLADAESRTVSNMAKVLIQQGVERLEQQLAAQAPAAAAVPVQPAPPAVPQAAPPPASSASSASAEIRAELEQRQQQVPRPLRRGPRRVRLQRPPI